MPRTRNTSSTLHPASRPCPRMIASVSPCPAVVMTHIRAPVRSSTAFVPIVVPCPSRVALPSSSGRVRPMLPASSVSPARTPSAGSSLLDSAFAVL